MAPEACGSWDHGDERLYRGLCGGVCGIAQGEEGDGAEGIVAGFEGQVPGGRVGGKEVGGRQGRVE